MSVFAITFRIHDNLTYQSRWNSVVNAIKELASETTDYWAETTSFFLLEYGGTAVDLANSIDVNSSFDEAVDLLVVINLSFKTYKIIGVPKDTDIISIMARR